MSSVRFSTKDNIHAYIISAEKTISRGILNIVKPQPVVKMASSSRGSIASGASSVFYTQQYLNFDDLTEQEYTEEYYPQFIQYVQDRGTSARPSIVSTLARIPRMSARASIASISHTLKRGRR